MYFERILLPVAVESECNHIFTLYFFAQDPLKSLNDIQHVKI